MYFCETIKFNNGFSCPEIAQRHEGHITLKCKSWALWLGETKIPPKYRHSSLHQKKGKLQKNLWYYEKATNRVLIKLWNISRDAKKKGEESKRWDYDKNSKCKD